VRRPTEGRNIKDSRWLGTDENGDNGNSISSEKDHSYTTMT
jgi:hypothetical protein